MPKIDTERAEPFDEKKWMKYAACGIVVLNPLRTLHIAAQEWEAEQEFRKLKPRKKIDYTDHYNKKEK